MFELKFYLFSYYAHFSDSRQARHVIYM